MNPTLFPKYSQDLWAADEQVDFKHLALVIRVHNAEIDSARVIQHAAARFALVVIVDDCSTDSCLPVAQVLQEQTSSVLVRLEGKPNRGRALRAGLQALLQSGVEVEGAITLDCGGMNTPLGLETIAKTLLKHPQSLVIGVMAEQTKPGWLQNYSRRLTRWLARHVLRLNIEEGMTFLRGIPSEHISDLLETARDKERYLSGMVFYARERGIEVIFQPVSPPDGYLPYLNPLEEYLTFFRYVIFSLLTTLVDYAVFLAAHRMTKNLLVSIYLARSVSVVVNYFLVREGVFYSGGSLWRTVPKYLALVALSGWAAARLMEYGMRQFGFDLVLAKMLAELTLYLFNFFMMRWFVFRNWRR